MTNITITGPGKHTNGTPCYVTHNNVYPGIVGYGNEPDDALASFERARAAYDELMQSKRPATPTVLFTMFRSVTVLRGLPPRPALAGA